MTDPALLHFFVDELTKEAVTVGNISKRVAPHLKEFGGQVVQTAMAPIRAMHPTGKYVRKAYQGLSNVSPMGKKEMAGWVAEKPMHVARHLVDDVSKGSGLMHKLRSGGWLSNTARYEGPSVGHYLANRAWRAMPGQKAMAVIPAAFEAKSSLQQKTDPLTGRKRGAGERLTSAGMGLGAGIISGSRMPANVGPAGFAGQMVGGTLASRIGSEIGSRSGRAVDEAIARKKARGTK